MTQPKSKRLASSLLLRRHHHHQTVPLSNTTISKQTRLARAISNPKKRTFCSSAEPNSADDDSHHTSIPLTSSSDDSSGSSLVSNADKSLTSLMTDHKIVAEYESLQRRKKLFSYSSVSCAQQLNRNLEKLPSDGALVPSSDPNFAPKLSFTQLQYLQSGRNDVPIQDGKGSLLFKDGSILKPMGRFTALPRLSHNRAKFSPLTKKQLFSSDEISNSKDPILETNPLKLESDKELQIFEWIEQTEHLYRNIYHEVIKPDPQLLDMQFNGKSKDELKLLNLPSDPSQFWFETGLNKNDIRNWNLLLAVIGEHSHSNPMYNSKTISGEKKREELLIQCLSVFQSISTFNAMIPDDDLDIKVQPLPESQQTMTNILNGGSVSSSSSSSSLSTRPSLRKHKELKPNLESYEILMKTLSKHNNQGNLIIDIMKEMGNDGYNPSQDCYRHLLTSMVNQSDGLGSLENVNILGYLRANSPHLDNRIELDLYTIAIKGLLKHRKTKQAKQIFDHLMNIEGEHPNQWLYTIFMDYFRLTRNVNGAIDLKIEMEDRGYLPSQKTYAKLLLAAAYGDSEDNNVLKMFELFNEMIITKELPPTQLHFCALIAGLGRIGDIESATRVLHLLDTMKISRNNDVYLYYLRAIADCVNKRVSGKITIGATKNIKLEHLIQLGESIVYNIMTHQNQVMDYMHEQLECGRLGDSIMMDNNNNNQMEMVHINIDIINALLSIYTQSGAANRAMLFWKTMNQRFKDVSMNTKTFDLIWTCIALKSKRYDDAKYLFDWFNDNHHLLEGARSMDQVKYGGCDERMHRTMVKLAAKFKDIRGCKHYLRSMKAKGMTVTQRDRAYLATILGSPAEQTEARRRLATENERARIDGEIRWKAKEPRLQMNHWSKRGRWNAERASGVQLSQARRTTGKIFFGVNRTLGQLDDPW